MDRLIAAGLNELQFSMQGVHAVQYYKNRRKSNFDILAEQIRLANHRREWSGQGPFSGIVTYVLKHEMDEANPQEFVDEGLRYVDKVAIDMTKLHFVGSDMMRCNRSWISILREKTQDPYVDIFLKIHIGWDGTMDIRSQDAHHHPE